VTKNKQLLHSERQRVAGCVAHLQMWRRFPSAMPKSYKKKGLAVKNRCHDFITIQFPIQNEW
jgi:hypothetical protein